MKKRILILVNTGTPDKPGLKHVRRYLSEFLNDKRVIDLPWLWRKILVNLIIVPFRAPKSAELYRRIWTKDGSPLRLNMEKLAVKVQGKVDEDTQVLTGMRYGNPSLKKILHDISGKNKETVVIFPLFPHYASSTTGSIEAMVYRETGKWNAVPQLKIVGQYYSNPLFVEALARQIMTYEPEKFDHLVFSYHGLPLSHVRQLHPGINPGTCTCDTVMPEYGSGCYRATCHETTRIIAARLNIAPGRCSTSFQSRMSEKWLTPFTDATLINLAVSGKQNVLVVAPSFASDCLETLEEIRHGYQKIFMNNGGSAFVVVPGLNDDDSWAEAIAAIYRQQC